MNDEYFDDEPIVAPPSSTHQRHWRSLSLGMRCMIRASKSPAGSLRRRFWFRVAGLLLGLEP